MSLKGGSAAVSLAAKERNFPLLAERSGRRSPSDRVQALTPETGDAAFYKGRVTQL